MAGTLTISTLSDGTNSTSSTNCIQGSAKAWVNYKGTTTRAIYASYNVSSVTFNATGDYTINFTNAISDANYSSVVSASASYGTGNAIININTANSALSEVAPTTTAFRFCIRYLGSGSNTDGVAYDTKYTSVAIFR